MNRRDFLKGSAVVGLAAACPTARGDGRLGEASLPGGMPKLTPPAKPAQLNLCLQWGGIPVRDDVNEKLDFLSANGFQAIETPSGLGWLREKGLKVAEGAKKRGLMLTTACGPSRFDYADKAKNDAEVAKFMPWRTPASALPRRPPRVARTSSWSRFAAARRRSSVRWLTVRRWRRRSARAAR